MMNNDAVERVAKAMFDTVLGMEEYEFLPMPPEWLGYAETAITAYNAYLRERATDADVVEAVREQIWAAWDGGNDAANAAPTIIPAALDAMLGKENADDR